MTYCDAGWLNPSACRFCLVLIQELGLVLRPPFFQPVAFHVFSTKVVCWLFVRCFAWFPFDFSRRAPKSFCCVVHPFVSAVFHQAGFFHQEFGWCSCSFAWGVSVADCSWLCLCPWFCHQCIDGVLHQEPSRRLLPVFPPGVWHSVCTDVLKTPHSFTSRAPWEIWRGSFHGGSRRSPWISCLWRVAVSFREMLVFVNLPVRFPCFWVASGQTPPVVTVVFHPWLSMVFRQRGFRERLSTVSQPGLLRGYPTAFRWERVVLALSRSYELCSIWLQDVADCLRNLLGSFRAHARYT